MNEPALDALIDVVVRLALEALARGEFDACAEMPEKLGPREHRENLQVAKISRLCYNGKARGVCQPSGPCSLTNEERYER